jgi:putative glutamine amidotransferase
VTGSWLHKIFGTTELEVNSFHHQAIQPKGLGDGLRACAWATDGTIEAIEGTDSSHFIVGVQWHPEMLEHFGVSLWKRLFQGFVDECRRPSAF